MDILAKLKASNLAIRTVVLGDVSVGLRILTEADALAAQIGSYQSLAALDLKLTVETADLADTDSNSQLLVLAIVDIETRTPLFKSAEQLREVLSREQRRFLIAEYLEHEQEYSPFPGKNMPDGEFNALLESLKKTPSIADLRGLSSATLRRLVLSLVWPAAS